MTPDDFSVFSKYEDAPPNAFGSKANPHAFVSSEDKQRYTNIYEALERIALDVLNVNKFRDYLRIRRMNYSPQYGARGHRPVDMWVSICGKDSDDFGKMPQVYIISSRRGVEVGFAVSINESDYYDTASKVRNREIVPRINSKLPNSGSELSQRIHGKLSQSSDWHYNAKARLFHSDKGWNAWGSFPEMVSFLKSKGSAEGGGSIARFVSLEDVSSATVEEQFREVADIFVPALLMCGPNSQDLRSLEIAERLEILGGDAEFDPSSLNDAKDAVLRSVVARRGQKSFRDRLLKAYGYRCAVSRTGVPAVLEAAHIIPYGGPATNSVNNGLLLRADIHTLFDLHLLEIDPSNLRVVLNSSLLNSPYKVYHGEKIHLPTSRAEQPSVEALALRQS